MELALILIRGLERQRATHFLFLKDHHQQSLIKLLILVHSKYLISIVGHFHSLLSRIGTGVDNFDLKS